MKSNKVTKIQTGLGLADVAVGSVLPTVSETALFLPVTKAIGRLMDGKGTPAGSQKDQHGATAPDTRS